jgi:4-hydroxybenzoate polyprenyltransferase
VYDYFNILPLLSQAGFLFLTLSIIFLVSGGNVINDYFDRKVDTINRPDEVIVGFSMKRRQAILIHLFLSIIGIICGFIASSIIGKAHIGWVFVLIALILLFYSTKFKRKPFLGLISAAILTAVVPLVVWIFEYVLYLNAANIDKNNEAIIITLYVIIGFSMFAFLFSMIHGLVKYCINYDGDKENSARTIPVLIGKKNSNYIIGCLSLLSVVFITIAERIFLSKIYFFTNNLLSTLYIYMCLVMPCIIFTIFSFAGTGKRKYILLDNILKIIILFGILFGLIFGFTVYGYIK